MAQPGGLTCSHGHKWSRANTRRDRNGHRQCIACERRRSRQCRARRRARAKPVEQHERHGSRPSNPVAAVLCDSGHSRPDISPVTRFDDVAAAMAFAARLPCENRACIGVHLVIWRRGSSSELGGVRIFQPAPPPLAVELFKLYPRSGHPEPVAWPAPVVLNEPLPPPRGTH